ncbi:MAG: 4'-phosphopantetheinyl transferase superfamily protein [Clostridia bacterium]|nr:4'-phosphopantetheinyl transferase superfamily protein [Clostridia bacterium]
MFQFTSAFYVTDVLPLFDECLFEKHLNAMPGFRIKKVESIKVKSEKLLSLGAGVLLSIALKDCGIDEYPEVETGQNGKPFFPAYSGFRFNLSHSGTKAVCVVSSFETGCDVELTEKANLKIANRYFTPNENALINSQKTDYDRRSMFCRLWTLKESYMKATGQGFGLSLSSFSIGFNNGSPFLEYPLTEDGFGFYEFNLNDEYKYSCCIKNDPEKRKPNLIIINLNDY